MYNINREKGIVTAYFEGGRAYWINCLEDKMAKIARKNSHLYIEVYPLLTNNIKHIVDSAQIIGQAKCNYEAGDVFDEELGKEIAKNRLIDRYMSVQKLVIQSFIDRLYALADSISAQYYFQ